MRSVLLAVLPLALAVAGCDSAHDGHAHADDGLVFVANQGGASLMLVDPATGTVGATVDLTDYGFSATAQPHHVVVEPDGSAYYVSLIGEGKVAKFDAHHRLQGTVSTPTPGMLAFGDDGLMYVSRSLSATNPPATVAVVDRERMRLVEERPVPYAHPHGLVPFAGGAFTASLRDNAVVALRADGTTASATVAGSAQGLSHLAYDPAARRLAVMADLTGQVHFFDAAADGSLTYRGAVTTGGRPWHGHFSRDGAALYVPLFGANAVAVVDVVSRTVTATISDARLAEPYMAMLSDDGRTLYVSCSNRAGTAPTTTPGDGLLAVVDLATRTVTRAVEVGPYPTGVGLQAHGEHAH